MRHSCWKIAILCVTVVVAHGCSSKQSPDGTEWLVVTTDTAQIESHRKRAEATEQQEFEAIFDGLGTEYSWIDPGTVRLIESRRNEALTRLNGMLTAGAPTAKSTAAALLLCRMEIVSGRAHLVRVLAEGNATLRTRVLNEIDHGLLGYSAEDEQRYREFLLGWPELVSGLLKQLDDADANVVKAAIECRGRLELPGAHEKLITLLARPDAPHRQRILFWLSKGPLTPELLDVALRSRALAVDPNSPPDTSLLQAFARSDEPVLRERARQELIRILEMWPDEGRTGFRGDRISLVEALADSSGPDDLDWLRAAAGRERGYYARGLLARLVTLEGDAGYDRLEAMLADPARRNDAIDVAGAAFAGSGDQRIVSMLVTATAGADAETVLRTSNVLLEIGGVEARTQAAALVSRMGPTQAEHFQGRLLTSSLEELAGAIAGAGVISAAAQERAQVELQAAPDHAGAEPPGLFEFLLSSGCALMFDAETGELPCRHDRLLQDFAAASDGMFQPEAVHQEWLQQDEDDFEGEYLLRFVHQDRMYTGRLRNYGDWYDVERTLEIVNRALSDAGVAQRFVALDTGDQTAAFVCADPAKLGPLAQKFHLPLSDNPAAAMQTGQEFEGRVLEQLKLEEL